MSGFMRVGRGAGAALVVLLAGWSVMTGAGTEGTMDAEPKALVDFKTPDEIKLWYVLNDVVMGGVSTSKISAGEGGTAVFEGNVSLENNGGFASLRRRPVKMALEGAQGLTVRVKGDGKRYKLRLRTNDALDGVAYQATFETKPDKWIEITKRFQEFKAVYRGNPVASAPVLGAAGIRQLGILISDAQVGPFRLEIAWIKASMASQPTAPSE
ncbi:MAG: CIA30 family protein [Planctomycetota bacterium]